MEELGNCNNSLRRLLGNSDRLGPMRRRRGSTVPKLFEQFRSQAARFHTAATKALRCQCSYIHSTILVVSNDLREGEELSSRAIVRHTNRLNVYFPLKAHTWSESQSEAGWNESWRAAEVEMAINETSCASRTLLSPSICGTSTTTSRTISVPENRSVSFAEAADVKESQRLNVPEGVSEIVDLCEALKTSAQQDSYIGFLRETDGRFHVMRDTRDSVVPVAVTRQLVSLGALLSGSSPKITLTRRIRLSIALSMAKMLLQLHSSPWLKDMWSKDDIYFFQNQDGYLQTACPLVVSHFNPKDSSRQTSSALGRSLHIDASRNSKSAMLSLGILVLELWFNQAIEAVPFRDLFLGPDGQENEYTRFNQAQKWQEQALEEGGIDLDNVTRRCVYCAFGAASQDLNDEEFQRAVCDEVVQGLEKLLAPYEDIRVKPPYR